MKYVVNGLLFMSVLMALIANPAPVSLELSDAILVVLTVLLAVLGLSRLHTYSIGRTESSIIKAIIIYLSSLLISALMGFMNGISVMMVLRSIGPYVLFIPLIFVGLLPEKIVSPRVVAWILIVVGLLQIMYLNNLYFSRIPSAATTLSVLRNRITFMDSRTTLPLMLSVPVLSLMISSDNVLGVGKKAIVQIVKGMLLLSGLWAGVITLTRAIFLSMMAGWLVFLIVYLFQMRRNKTFLFNHFILKMAFVLIFFIGVIAALSLIPRVHLIETGLLARFHGAAVGSGGDYSNGRVHDEWIPALNTWLQSGPLGLVFGIGAGNAFKVLSGEERTYIHNLTVYSLVYGGLYGFFATLNLYFALFRALVFRAIHTQKIVYTGMAAILFSLYFYGQLFAVHKGFAFNQMLFLIAAVSLIKTKKNTINNR